MAQFRYKAKNMEGKMRRGVMEAVSEKALQQDLKEQGFYLISAKKAGGLRGRKKFTSRQLAEFNRELSSLLTAASAWYGRWILFRKKMAYRPLRRKFTGKCFPILKRASACRMRWKIGIVFRVLCGE